MSDLVERLRSPATVFYEYAADEGALLKEAADEIERLTGERDEAESTLATIKDEYPKLRSKVFRLECDLAAAHAERDRLAKTLAEAIEQYDHEDNEGYYRPLDNAMEAARAALAALPPKEDENVPIGWPDRD